MYEKLLVAQNLANAALKSAVTGTHMYHRRDEKKFLARFELQLMFVATLTGCSAAEGLLRTRLTDPKQSCNTDLQSTPTIIAHSIYSALFIFSAIRIGKFAKAL